MRNTNKIIRVVFAAAIFASAFFGFGLSAQAGVCDTYIKPIVVITTRDTSPSHKVVAGTDSIKIKIYNPNPESLDPDKSGDSYAYHIYMYPEGTPDTPEAHASFETFTSTSTIILPQQTVDYELKSQIKDSMKGNRYEVRVTAAHLNSNKKSADFGRPDCSFGDVDLFPFEVASSTGVMLSADPNPANKGTQVNITSKFFPVVIKGAGYTDEYALYVDGNQKPVTNKVIANNGDGDIHNYTWDTSETDPGDHDITVKVFHLKQNPDGTLQPDSSGGSNLTSLKVTIRPAGTGSGTTPPGSGASGGGQVDTTGLNKTLKYFMSCGKTGGLKTDSLNGVVCLIETVTNYLLDLAGVIAFIMILYASIIYLTSYGEESKAELAKKTLTWSVIGVIVISLAKAILFIVGNMLKNPSGPL